MAFKMRGYSGFTKTDPPKKTDGKDDYFPNKNETWESWNKRTKKNWKLSDRSRKRTKEQNMYYDDKKGYFVTPTPIVD